MCTFSCFDFANNHIRFFGYLCVGAEFTYVVLYALVHCWQAGGNSSISSSSDVVVVGPVITKSLLTFLAVCVPGCVLKQLVNVMQLLSAGYAIAKGDADMYNQAHIKIASKAN
jgi:hypothetical protein